MSVTIPSLSDVTDILDTDMVMVTQSGGQSYKISGLELNKRNQAVIASSTTLTGAPLKTGNIVRAYFTADITGVNTTTGLVLSYNGTSINVKVPKDGALVNFTAQNLGGTPTVYKYLQAYTTLELLYDGTYFVIIGNPVILSSSTYLYYADGTHNVDSIASNNMQSVSSNAIAQMLFSLLQKMDWRLIDNSTQSFTMPNNECFLFMNIHVINQPAQIEIIRVYNGVLKRTVLSEGSNPVNINILSGNTVQFQATGVCRGYLWRFNGASTS